MSFLQKIVLWFAGLMFLVWGILHFSMIAGDENGKARFFLGIVFAVIILARRKEEEPVSSIPSWVTPFTAIAGAILSLAGIIFVVGQFEWLGLMLLIFSALQWSLGRRYSKDIFLALFVLYWIHPLPGQLFSKFQLVMQVLSVKATEWLLHCLNFRVWADGIMLNTGFQSFLVPESCSGMVTAVTVLLTGLGVGIFLRMRWFEIAALLVIGAAQVLVLNILRIFLTVAFSVRMPKEWADSFLHDTLGLLLFAGILLVQVEAVFWKMRTTGRLIKQKGISAGEIEQPERGTILPRFWRVMKRWALPGLVMIVLAAGIVFAVYKRRPAHRAAMISDVVDGLMERDLEKAERAINVALRLKPGDRDLRSRRIHVMVIRGKYSEALAELDALGSSLSTMETVLKSFSLMSLKRADEAIGLIESLPESEKKAPGVAMIRAEYAVGKDKPAIVASNAVLASASLLLINRVRGLFPYLGEHKQWRAVLDSDRENIPYRDCVQALIVIYAGLELNDIFRASRALKAGLAAWPNDPRFIGSLYMISARRPGSEWERLFADSIKANVAKLDADRLASYIEYCFKLSRPDLAWLLYLRLKEVDSRDPGLYLAPAQFGSVWFDFRRHQLGIAATGKDFKIDLITFYQQTKNLKPFMSFWEKVPLAEELSADSSYKKRREYLSLCLAELERRKAAGIINRRMYMTYPEVLTMAGRYKEAGEVINDLEEKYPDASGELLLRRAVLYNQQGLWQESYEILRKYRMLSAGGFNLNSDTMLINAMMNLNMGICAMEVARHASETFPDFNQALMMVAAIWNIFGFKEQALFVLSKRGEQEWNSAAIAQLLYETGCYRAAERLSRSVGVNIVRNSAYEKQGVFPVPAEQAIARQWPEPFTSEELAREAGRFEKESGQSASPFIRKLRHLSAEWCRQHGRGDVSSLQKWLAIGRDNMEKATAMYQLAMLLVRQKQYAQAETAIREAVVMMPRSAILWRVLVLLTKGDTDVILNARRACPSDPELWLASMVTRVGKEGGGKWLIDEIKNVAADGQFAPGTMARAGDFLLRKKCLEPASMAARNAIDRGQGSIAAYVLGLQCALTEKDMRWALSCALRGIECSRDPAPFYRLLVSIKSIGTATDVDTVTALEYLKEHFPKETQWGERLGDVYFQKGNIRRAMNVFEETMFGNLSGVKVRSLLLAAEAARLEGDYAKAIKILESAYALHPDMPGVLNNLVYNLVRHGENRENVMRAKELLPKLIEIGGKSAYAMDTIAMAYMEMGNLPQAKKYSQKARELIDRGEYAGLEVDFNAAEVLFRMGELGDAKEILEKIIYSADKSRFVETGTRELLKKIKEESR